LLNTARPAPTDIHPADLSDLLGRFGIDLIAERIEGERAVVDLLDYDVRFGQGFLFAAPRPLRPETASATGEAPDKTQVPNAAARPAPDALKADPQRLSGNAALARRAVGPG
jgi:cyclic-di-GMP phosphodiesterase, flagellum assembly factor TipF